MTKPQLTLEKTYPLDVLEARLKQVSYRGVYDKNGEPLRPYDKARFSLAKVYPSKTIAEPPLVEVRNKTQPLFTPQPTIYSNQTYIMEVLDEFLQAHQLSLSSLTQMVEYVWPGRGSFHVLPPIIEQHSYVLKNGFVDLDGLAERFTGCFVKDAANNLHQLSNRYLDGFHIDEVSTLDHLDVFHSNASLVNYGLSYSGTWQFNIICDGSHRIDYAIEKKNEPITVLLVEPEAEPFLPYYAFPMPFRPTLRLSSKLAERMYPRLERDKFHILNDFIRKVLHYDWTEAGLDVSSLRSQTEIN